MNQSRFEKWSALSTIGATIISGIALLVSIYVILDSKKQNREILGLTKYQMELSYKQWREDSASSDSRFAKEDSTSMSRDSFNRAINNEQLNSYKKQNQILMSQYESQRQLYNDQLFLNRPLLNFQMAKAFSENDQDTLMFTIINKGKREVTNIIIEPYFINLKNKGYAKGTSSYIDKLYPIDSVNFDYVGLSKLLVSSKFDDFLVFFQTSFFDPVLKTISHQKDYLNYIKRNGNYYPAVLDFKTIDEVKKILLQKGKKTISKSVKTK